MFLFDTMKVPEDDVMSNEEYYDGLDNLSAWSTGTNCLGTLLRLEHMIVKHDPMGDLAMESINTRLGLEDYDNITSEGLISTLAGAAKGIWSTVMKIINKIISVIRGAYEMASDNLSKASLKFSSTLTGFGYLSDAKFKDYKNTIQISGYSDEKIATTILKIEELFTKTMGFANTDSYPSNLVRELLDGSYAATLGYHSTTISVNGEHDLQVDKEPDDIDPGELNATIGSQVTALGNALVTMNKLRRVVNRDKSKKTLSKEQRDRIMALLLVVPKDIALLKSTTMRHRTVAKSLTKILKDAQSHTA